MHGPQCQLCENWTWKWLMKQLGIATHSCWTGEKKWTFSANPANSVGMLRAKMIE